MTLTENDIELYAIDLLINLGYQKSDSAEIINERRSNSEVVLVDRLKQAIDKFNPDLNQDAREDALKKVLRVDGPNLLSNNQYIHRLLVDGIDVEYRQGDRIKGDKALLIDFKNPENNEFLVVSQFTVVESGIPRRPDIMLFINGLPLVIIELKNAVAEKATIGKAFEQLQTYKNSLMTLFQYNQLMIVSDGMDAKVGSISSDWSRFMKWKSPDKQPSHTPEMKIMIEELLNKKTLLDFIKHFIVFEKEKKSVIKKLAAYHQYYAVNKAITATKNASAENGDRRCGVVWHTQGSGKSLSMVFYTGKLVLELDNPTIVVLTDRNDLDDQLFATFSNCIQLLRQKPVQAEKRSDLQKLLSVASGGVVFTTIQKFFPENDDGIYPALTNRKNVIVVADEAHRSQYGFNKKIKVKEDGQVIETYGMAKYLRDALPNASFIGFTGTPIELTDKSTPAVFGNYIDIYDIEQAVNDQATVRIYYESRLAKLHIKEEEKDSIDNEFEGITENQEAEEKHILKSRWAKVEAIVGSPQRLKDIAKDLVEHYEARTSVLEGKAMIVCMSRRICVELYSEIIKLRSEWDSDDDEKGIIKVVMTGSASDKSDWQKHIRNKAGRRLIADRMKDPENSLKLVIVRDMWLTGFDAPSIHTLYNDKPMKGHNLMQAIARVNRVFKNKPGGLIVDYLGIASDLRYAMSVYTESGGSGKPNFEQEDAVKIMKDEYEIICQLYHGFNFREFFTADTGGKLSIILAAEEHILKQEDGVERYVEHVNKLLKAYSISVPHHSAIELRDDVAFFQAIKARLIKVSSEAREKSDEEIDSAIKQIVSRAVTSDGVIDIFAATGLNKPEISILSDSFLEEVKGMKHKNLAFEALKQLLNNEIKQKSKNNLVQSKAFSKMLEEAIKKYQNKTIEVSEVLNELIQLAKEIRKEEERGNNLNLTSDEVAFYDALEVNDSAVKILGDEQLREIARELIKSIRSNTTIDWTIKESVQAKMKRDVKRILTRFGYPPDKQRQAIDTVLKQAELLCADWVSDMPAIQNSQSNQPPEFRELPKIEKNPEKIVNLSDYSVDKKIEDIPVSKVAVNTAAKYDTERKFEIKNLIWPLSSPYYIVTENENDISKQLNRCFKIFEMLTAFKVTILLSALDNDLKIKYQKEIWPDNSDKERFTKVSFGTWVDLYRRLVNLYNKIYKKDQDILETLPFGPEFYIGISDKKIIDHLNEIIIIRNKHSHGGDISNSIIKKDVEDMLQRIKVIYEKFTVYSDLSLIFPISMKKDGLYKIIVKKLDGNRYPFVEKQIVSANDIETDKLYLYNPVSQDKLKLLPELIKLVECEECGHTSLYLFSKLVSKNAHYISYFNEIHPYKENTSGFLNELR